MKLPSVDHLFWMRHDTEKFEAERSRILEEYLDTVPAEHQEAARGMQAKIDEARKKLSPADFLKWMQREASELASNLSDQFGFVKHKAEDIRKQLKD